MDGDFGRFLRNARRRRGMTQRALAQLSGVHQPTIAAIETGRRRPTETVRSALVAAVRLRPSEALHIHRDQVRAVIERHRGADPMVFGSVARGEDTVESDLDLMVTFEPGTTDLADLLELVEELEEITGVRVEVISGRAGGPVVERARHEAVPL
ncbi:Cro/Cl family transcriptional regulator [Geodermatophilus sp. TF02-6]|uniref:helix-turn-helix domain-containing protein n=1 Tax=Geodermatophilus sp. TF02-6 TaxID=2250575 RepID=UPI000DE95F43|nr:XRE family transcriptional regulator [Geodermatophilus sp. TF02-6]RBY83591.1 Cro/Cl family transcriptional regulator [Geodermatophilus sp. TF02-6]